MRIMHISRASLMFCQFLIPVIKAQQERGHYVCVYGSEDADAQKLRDIGIDVFSCHWPRSLNPFVMIKAMLQMRKTLIEQGIDVVICHTPIGAAVGRMAAKLAGIDHVIYFAHGLPCAPNQNIFLWFVWFCIEKVLAKITNAIIVMNSYDENLAVNHLAKETSKVFRISGMGVDLKKFNAESSETDSRQIKTELEIAEGKKIVLCLAYLIRAKGVFLLLEAARRICAQRNDVCFLLAGTGPAMAELQKSVKSNHLEENFRLLGWRNDVYRLMQCADIFTLPTYYFEGLPVSILEAMACSKPVIATKHRGCEDVVLDGQTGILVPIKQVPPLVDSILLLLDNAKKRKEMGREGRKLVENNFDLDLCTEKIADLVEQVWERNKHN